MSTGTPVTGRGRLLRRIILLASGSILSMAFGFAALSDAVDLFGRSGGDANADAPATAPAAEAAPAANAAADGAEPAPEGVDGGSPTADRDDPAVAAGQGVYHRRDPFSPVISEETAVTHAANDPVTTAAPVTDPEPGTGPTPAAPVIEAPATPGDTPASAPVVTGCSPDGDAYVCDGVLVSLGNVGTDAAGELRAVIQVDTTVYEGVQGVTLPGGYEVVRVTSSCVDLRYGGQAFQLCESDRALK